MYSEILELTGYPAIQTIAIDHFFQAIHENNSKFPDHGCIGFAYYTFDETDWKSMGLTRDGLAQGCLYVNDPQIITTTALIFTKFGEKFMIYFGEESQIHEMICLEIFIRFELNRISSFFSQKISQLYNFYDNTIIEFGGLALPNITVIQKMKKWNDVKKMIVDLFEIIDLTENSCNYSIDLKKNIDGKKSFFNGPSQILYGDEKENHHSVIHHPISNFFKFQFNANQQIENLNSHVDPIYKGEWIEVNEKIIFTKKLSDSLYLKSRDLQTAYQTEFSIYAFYVAIIALIISIIVQIITIIL